MSGRSDSSDDNDRGGEVQQATMSNYNERKQRHKSSRHSSKRSRERRSRSSSSESSARRRNRHSRERAPSARSPSMSDSDQEYHRESRRRLDKNHSSRRSSSSEDDRAVHRKSDRLPSKASKKRRSHASYPDNRHRRKKHHTRRHSSSSSSSSVSDERDHRRKTAYRRSSGKSRKRSRRSSSSPESSTRQAKRYSRRHSSSSSSSLVSDSERNRSRRSKYPSPESNMPSTSADPLRSKSYSDDDYHESYGDNRGQRKRSSKKSSSTRGRQPESPTQSEPEVLSDGSETDENSETWPPFVSLFKELFEKFPYLKLIDPRKYREAAVTIERWIGNLDATKFVDERVGGLKNHKVVLALKKTHGWDCIEELRNAFTQCRNADIESLWKAENALLANVNINQLQSLVPILRNMADAMEQEYENKALFEAQQKINTSDLNVEFAPWIVFYQNTGRRAQESDHAYSRRLQKKITKATEAYKKQVAELAETFPFVNCQNEYELVEWGNEFFDAIATNAPSNVYIFEEKVLAVNELEDLLCTKEMEDIMKMGLKNFVREKVTKSSEKKNQALIELHKKFNLPDKYGPKHYLEVLDALVTVQSLKLEIKNLELVKKKLEVKMKLLENEEMFREKHTIPKECRKYLLMDQKEWFKEGNCFVFLDEVKKDYLVLDILTDDRKVLEWCHKIVDRIILKQISKEESFTQHKMLVMTHHMTEDDDSYWRQVSSASIDQWKIDNNIRCHHQLLPNEASLNPPAPWILRGTLKQIETMKKCLDGVSERNENARRENRVSQTTTILNVPYHFGKELEKFYGEDLQRIESTTQASILLLGPNKYDFDEYELEFKGRFEKVEAAVAKVEALGQDAERVEYIQIEAYYKSDIVDKLAYWNRAFRPVSILMDDLMVNNSFTVIVSGPNDSFYKPREALRKYSIYTSANKSRCLQENIRKREFQKEERMERYAKEKMMKEKEESRIWEEKRRAVNM